MNRRTRLVLHYTPNNLFSFNVLVGALETDPGLAELEIVLEPRRSDLLRRLREYESDRETTVVAFSFATPQYFKIRETVLQIRQTCGRSLLVAGGPHPSGLPEHTLRTGFHFIVEGEGEEAFPGLIKAIAGNGDPTAIPGVSWLDDSGRFRRTPPGPVRSLDDFPAFAEKHGLFNPIEITRGCVHGCLFCQTSRLLGKSMRHRSVENTAAHVRTMVTRGERDVRFISPDGFSYGSSDGRDPGEGPIRRLLEAVSGEMRHDGRIFFGAFPSEVRPERVTAEKLDLVRRMTSNTNLIIGAQSGSDRLLRLCGRGHTVADIERACALTLDAGLAPNIDIVFGLPDEIDTDRKETLSLIRRLAKSGVRVHGHAFMPLAGTPWWGRQPVRPEGRFLRSLELLTARRILWGSWKMQASLGAKIYGHFKNSKCPENPGLEK